MAKLGTIYSAKIFRMFIKLTLKKKTNHKFTVKSAPMNTSRNSSIGYNTVVHKNSLDGTFKLRNLSDAGNKLN